MAFHDVRFPTNLSFGAIGGPERRTEIVALASGFEERNTPWAHARRRFDAGMGLRSLDDLSALVAFFEARAGQLHGFRWKDWADYKSCPASRAVDYEDQYLGLGDGVTTAFALRKTYASGGVEYLRPITKPVEGTVKVGIQGNHQAEAVHFGVDFTSGIVTFFEPPGEGARVTAGFEFDVPVRFDTDRLPVKLEYSGVGSASEIKLVEVRPDEE